MKPRFLTQASLSLLACFVLLMAGCGQSGKAVGPSGDVIDSLDKMLKTKAADNSQFNTWVKSSGKYTAADLDGRWDWSFGIWDPARNTYVFQDSGAKILFKKDDKDANALTFDIKDKGKNPKGSVLVDTRKVPSLTFYTTVAAPPDEKGAVTGEIRVPAGFYITLYGVENGQSRLIMWDPARDAVFQARRVATERFRGLGDTGEADVLPSLPPGMQTATAGIPPTPGGAPGAGLPGGIPAAPGGVPGGIPGGVPGQAPPGVPGALPGTAIPNAPTPVPLPQMRPVGSLVGTWKVLMQGPAEQYVLFKPESFEIYVSYMGQTLLIDCGVYAVEGATLTSRSNVTGEMSTSTLSLNGNVLTVAAQHGIIRLQRVR